MLFIKLIKLGVCVYLCSIFSCYLCLDSFVRLSLSIFLFGSARTVYKVYFGSVFLFSVSFSLLGRFLFQLEVSFGKRFFLVF